MFNANRVVIDAFVADSLNRFREAFPSNENEHEAVLEQAVRTSMEMLLQCDCPYHDLHHTILVTDAGQTILQGRMTAQGDIAPDDWLHAVVAMLFHDIGYVRGLLRDDRAGNYVADESGARVNPPPGVTDAYLMPYHVTRGCMFVHERFAAHPLIDVAKVAGYIEMTRFPVPGDRHYQRVDTYAGLVRAADLIGQMGDPLYPSKLSRLYAEFVETGEAARLGYTNAEDLRTGFADFFYFHVYPYITEGLRFLRRTQEGQQWIANLFHHVHETHRGANVTLEPPVARPQIAVSNPSPSAARGRLATSRD